MSNTWRFFGQHFFRLAMPRLARAFVLIAFALSQLELLGTVRAAEPIVIDSALLKLIQQIDVPARAQGQLVSLRVAEGDKVQQGALLGQIDDSEAQLLQKKAALELDLQKAKVS